METFSKRHLPTIGHDPPRRVDFTEKEFGMHTIIGRGFTLMLLLGFVLSYAAAQAPTANLPPLVPCDDAAEGMPCVDIVTEMADIVGVWRRYYQGASAMAFTEFREDGTLSIVQSLPGDDRVTGTVTFEDGVAAFAANPDGPAAPACIEPGMYVMRLIRVGEHPVALVFDLANDDQCLFRVLDFSMPMLAYGGTGAELAMDPDVAALAQPLVPCPDEGDEAYPCDVVVTHAAEVAGIWKQYMGRPDLMAPGGMGYQRINPDGSIVLADAPENTGAPFGSFPFGTLTFEGGEVRLSVDAPNVPPTCQSATSRYHLYRHGDQPVALLMEPVEDECAPRLRDTRMPFIWVAGID
jgi:hypothetical protein